MPNLDAESTGLSRGTIYISFQDGGHGPRVKYYRGSPSKSVPSASMSISDEPELLVDGLRMTAREQREVAAFVRLNKALLLELWYSDDGVGDLLDFLDRFQGIR